MKFLTRCPKRFSLRGILVLICLVAVAIAIPLRYARLQKQARVWLTSVRGDYAFEHKVGRNRDVFAPRDATSPRIYCGNHNAKDLLFPHWCVSLVGPDLFTRVVSANVDTRDTKDLGPLAKLRYLRALSIHMSPADKLDFSPLSNIATLERLYLDGIEYSEADIARIRAVLPGVKICLDTLRE